MLRLLPFPIFICIYLFSWWRCKKNIIASDKQLKPCIDWAYIKNLPLPPKPVSYTHLTLPTILRV